MPRIRLLVALLAVSATLGCRQGNRPSRAHGSAEPGSASAGEAGTAKDTTPPPPCGGVGTPWDGYPKGCVYEHEGCCYADAETACAAASCPAPRCQVLESAPAQVACD